MFCTHSLWSQKGLFLPVFFSIIRNPDIPVDLLELPPEILVLDAGQARGRGCRERPLVSRFINCQLEGHRVGLQDVFCSNVIAESYSCI